MTTTVLRFLSAIFASSLATTLAPPAAAQDYPSKPIRIIALSSPGSGPDIVGRLVGGKLTEAWGQQVIVDPRPGATGIVGTEIASKSPPDGLTLVIITSQAVIVSVMYDNLPYSLVRDFTPITLVGTTPFILAVHPVVPATSIKQLIALAKSKPGELRYGSGGTGSPPHLSAEIFKRMTGTDMLHVPYKGTAGAVTDLLGGRIDYMFLPAHVALQHIQAGKLKAIATGSAKRLPQLPDVPTLAEAGVTSDSVDMWYGVLAPKGTPADVIARLNQEIAKVLALPEVATAFKAQGMVPATSSAGEFGNLIAKDAERWATVVKRGGITAE